MMADLLQPTHLIILFALVVLLFGGRWFATLGTGFRDAIRNFRKANSTSDRK